MDIRSFLSCLARKGGMPMQSALSRIGLNLSGARGPVAGGRVAPSPGRLALIATIIVVLASLAAESSRAEADGPDAWRVTGVAEDDVLNMRMGPGTRYPIIDALPPGARHLTAVTCVPLATYAQFERLSESERENLPPRWCLVHDAAGQRKGWVAQRYLAEDTLARGSRPAANAWAGAVPPPWDIAVPLVRNLYRSYAVAGPEALQDIDWLQSYFFLDMARWLVESRPRVDPLYGGQDAEISDLRVAFDRDRPVTRGMATVIVTFLNFGERREAAVNLRPDPQQGGAIRIFRVRHQDGLTIPAD